MFYEFFFGTALALIATSIAFPAESIPFRWIRRAFDMSTRSASKRMKDTLQMVLGWGAMLLGIYVAVPVPHRYDPAVALLLVISVAYYWWRGRHTGSELEDRHSMIDVTPSTGAPVKPARDQEKVL